MKTFHQKGTLSQWILYYSSVNIYYSSVWGNILQNLKQTLHEQPFDSATNQVKCTIKIKQEDVLKKILGNNLLVKNGLMDAKSGSLFQILEP